MYKNSFLFRKRKTNSKERLNFLPVFQIVFNILLSGHSESDITLLFVYIKNKVYL